MGPVGLILAGGRATRLGGGDKPLRLLGGRTILSRVTDRLAPQCGGLLLSANGDPARFAGWPHPIVADHPEDRNGGPLAGLLAGLDWVAARDAAPAVLSVPGDTPFLPPDLVARLAAAGAGRRIAFARSATRDHGLTALWPLAIRDRLRDALRRDGERRVFAFLGLCAAIAIEWPAIPVDPFLNINTPEDLAAAERLAED